MVRAKIIVAQKTVTSHFWGLYFFNNVHWSKYPEYWDTRSSEVLVLTEKSTLPGVYMVKHWLCFLPRQPHLSRRILTPGDGAGIYLFITWMTQPPPSYVGDLPERKEHLASGQMGCQSSGLQEAPEEQRGSLKRSGRRVKKPKASIRTVQSDSEGVKCHLFRDASHHPSLWKAKKNKKPSHLKSLKWQMSWLNCPANKDSLSLPWQPSSQERQRGRLSHAKLPVASEGLGARRPALGSGMGLFAFASWAFFPGAPTHAQN